MRTVLVVDDDAAMLRLLEKMLRVRHIALLLAPRPLEALRLAESQPIDALICDYRMPEMDGLRLAERVRKLHPAVAVLLISGNLKEAPAGAKHMRFLAKPFFPSDLLRHLRELLPEA